MGQPVFLNIKTVIGLGTSVAGTHYAHEDPFGVEDVARAKRAWGLNPAESHQIGEDVYQYWSEVPKRGAFYKRQWEDLLSQYDHKHPDLAKELAGRVAGRFDPGWKRELADYTPAREYSNMLQASAAVHSCLWPKIPLFSGSADLLAVSGVTKSGVESFGSRNTETLKANFSATYIHYGVREHGMMAVANGIAAYAKCAFLPVTSTFSAFQLYGAAALRMSALCDLQVVHIGTHDSIEEGVCGPSHQVRIE